MTSRLSGVCQSRAAYLYDKILATRYTSGKRKIVRFGRSSECKRVIIDRSKNRLSSGIMLGKGNLSSHFLTFGAVCSAVDKSIIAPLTDPSFSTTRPDGSILLPERNSTRYMPFRIMCRILQFFDLPCEHQIDKRLSPS
jgi:hypothetical protein